MQDTAIQDGNVNHMKHRSDGSSGEIIIDKLSKHQCLRRQIEFGVAAALVVWFHPPVTSTTKSECVSSLSVTYKSTFDRDRAESVGKNSSVMKKIVQVTKVTYTCRVHGLGLHLPADRSAPEMPPSQLGSPL